MTKQNIFFLTFIFCVFAAHHCFAMEKEQLSEDFVIIDNGLLTEIDAKIVRTTEDNKSDEYRKISSITTKKDTLANLIKYRRMIIRHETPKIRYYSTELFCPILLKENGDGIVENLGQFNPYTHKNATEAIRQNKALYFTWHQGAIIYNHAQQPNTQNIKQIKKDIEDFQREYSEKITIPTQRDKSSETINIYGDNVSSWLKLLY